jgi:simple sugar transport system permease protein
MDGYLLSWGFPHSFSRSCAGRDYLVCALEDQPGPAHPIGGENPSVAEVSGINVAKTRYLCVIVAGMLMGLSGAIYSLDYNPVWTYNVIMGWGFIALALVFLDVNPFILLAGSSLSEFSGSSPQPQLVLPGILSRYIWRTVPFIITLEC